MAGPRFTRDSVADCMEHLCSTSPVGLDLHKARTHRLQVSPETRFRDRVFSLRGSSHGDGPPRSRVPRATRGVTRRCDTPRFTRSLKSAIVCRMFDIYRHEGTSSACLACSSFPTTHGMGTSQNEGLPKSRTSARKIFSPRHTVPLASLRSADLYGATWSLPRGAEVRTSRRAVARWCVTRSIPKAPPPEPPPTSA